MTMTNMCRQHMARTMPDKAQRSDKTWNQLTQLTCRALALHKCKWGLMAWKEENGVLKMIDKMEEQILLEDGLGGHATILLQPLGKPNNGLGYQICLDRN